MRYYLAIPALAGLALAQDANSTLEFFFPGGYEGVDPVASVVKANPSTTILNIACPTSADSTECGFGPGIEYSIISTTIYQASMTEEGRFTMTMSCDHNTEAAEMTCGISMDGGNEPGTQVEVLKGTDIAYVTATVTKGAELLTQGGGKESGVAGSVVQTSADASANPTGSAASGSQAQETAPSVTGSGASPENTNAAYKFGAEGTVLLALVAAVLNAW